MVRVKSEKPLREAVGPVRVSTGAIPRRDTQKAIWVSVTDPFTRPET